MSPTFVNLVCVCYENVSVRRNEAAVPELEYYTYRIKHVCMSSSPPQFSVLRAVHVLYMCSLARFTRCLQHFVHSKRFFCCCPAYKTTFAAIFGIIVRKKVELLVLAA